MIKLIWINILCRIGIHINTRWSDTNEECKEWDGYSTRYYQTRTCVMCNRTRSKYV